MMYSVGIIFRHTVVIINTIHLYFTREVSHCIQYGIYILYSAVTTENSIITPILCDIQYKTIHVASVYVYVNIQ